MFGSILKIMLRNLRKHKAFSFINIMGLAVGMACCLMILMFIRDELSYDRLNVRGDRIFRLNSHSTIGGTTRRFARSPAALAPAIKETIPEVLAYARVFQMGRAQFLYEGKNIDIPDFYGADEDFFNIFSHEFLAGAPAEALKKPNTFVLTEAAAVQIFGTSDVLGKVITINQGRRRDFTATGVIRDFHHNSLKTAINPTVLKLNPEGFAYVSVRISPANISSTLAFLEKTFKELLPQLEYRSFFVDDDFRRKYPNEEKGQSVFTYFGVLAIFVACLGLFGLASFIIERRTKEIGIRKTLGAGGRRIVLLLSREFLRAVLLANIVAWPLAFYFMNRWLGTFAYRIGIAWWFFLLGGLLSVAIAFLTVSFQSVKSARTDPIDALRCE